MIIGTKTRVVLSLWIKRDDEKNTKIV